MHCWTALSAQMFSCDIYWLFKQRYYPCWTGWVKNHVNSLFTVLTETKVETLPKQQTVVWLIECILKKKSMSALPVFTEKLPRLLQWNCFSSPSCSRLLYTPSSHCVLCFKHRLICCSILGSPFRIKQDFKSTMN